MPSRTLRLLLVVSAKIVFAAPDPGSPAAWLRDLMGGSDLRARLASLYHQFILPEADWSTYSHAGPIVRYPNGLYEQTFISKPVELSNGHIANQYFPISWPEGHIGLSSFNADIVKAPADGTPLPIEPCCGGKHAASFDEAYLHHWTVLKWNANTAVQKLMEISTTADQMAEALGWPTALADAGVNRGSPGPCWTTMLHTFFGVGNEARGVNLTFPSEQGALITDSADMKARDLFMVLNLHAIDIRNVSDVRGCTECECRTTGVTPPWAGYRGGLECCKSTHIDGAKCPIAAGTSPTTNTYHVRYTMQWRRLDEQEKPMSPVERLVLDITDNNTMWSDFLPGGVPQAHQSMNAALELTLNDAHSGIGLKDRNTCHIEYYVPACNASAAAPGSPAAQCKHVVRNSWTLPAAYRLIFVTNHFHAGGRAITVRYGNATALTTLCRATSTSTTTPLNRTFITGIDTCSPPQPITLPRGTRIEIEAEYQQDELPRFGAMAYSSLYAVRLTD